VAHSDPRKLVLAEKYSRQFPEELRDDRGAGLMLRTGESQLQPEIGDEMLAQAAQNPEHLRMIRQIGIRSYMAAPMLANGRAVGVIRFVSSDTERRFTKEDLRLAEALAHRAGTAVDNARLHRKLAGSEARFRQMANTIPQLAWMADTTGRRFWFNDGWYRYTGTTPEQMENDGWKAIHDPELLPTVLARWDRSLKTGEPFEMVFPLRGADGVLRPFLTRVSPFRDDSGVVVRWFGTNTDIGDLQAAQQALADREVQLRVSQERLRITQSVARLATWELDIDEDRFTWSDEAFAMLGRPDLGSKRSDFLSLMYYSGDKQDFEQALKTSTTRNRELDAQFRIIRSDGEARWIAARGRPFYNQGRSLMLGVFFDITEAHHSAAQTQEKPKRGKKKTG
jgi:PAS domain S-box-containing protein